MRLLNVRLDDDDADLVRRLRDRGISISKIVRGAIRSEAQRLQEVSASDPGALLAEMQARYPGPANTTAAHRVDSADRKQVQELVRAKLRRRT